MIPARGVWGLNIGDCPREARGRVLHRLVQPRPKLVTGSGTGLKKHASLPGGVATTTWWVWRGARGSLNIRNLLPGVVGLGGRARLEGCGVMGWLSSVGASESGIRQE